MRSYKVVYLNLMRLIWLELSTLLKMVYPLGPNITYMLVGLYTGLSLLVGHLHTIDSTRGT
jgi:hypothetical protein